MKAKHVTNSIFAKLLKVDAITIYPFIFYSMKFPSKTLKQHEMIHVDQVRELGWFKFYFSYLLEYIRLYRKYKNQNTAYFNISYEKEAYKKQEIDRKDFS
jgi:hypothetical protein